MVSNPSYAETAAGVAKRIIKEEGFFKGLYEGFSFVLTRQVLFGMVKFLVFDTFASWVYSLVPVLRSLVCSCALLFTRGNHARILRETAHAQPPWHGFGQRVMGFLATLT